MKGLFAVPIRNAPKAFQPGTYLRCSACGRLLKIEWATRSIVCACGAKIPTGTPKATPDKPDK
jgi:hypothetical protein